MVYATDVLARREFLCAPRTDKTKLVEMELWYADHVGQELAELLLYCEEKERDAIDDVAAAIWRRIQTRK